MPFFIIWLIKHSTILEITLDHIIRLRDFSRFDDLRFTQMLYRYAVNSGTPSITLNTHLQLQNIYLSYIIYACFHHGNGPKTAKRSIYSTKIRFCGCYMTACEPCNLQ